MSTAQDAAASGKPAPKKTPTREEMAKLKSMWRSKLLLAHAQVEKAREPFDAAKEGFTALIHEARADLGKSYTRKRLVGWVEDSTARLRNLLQEEQDRFEDRVDLGLPVYGTQADLFGADPDKTPPTHRDAIFWEAEGYLVGRRAGERKALEGCPPEHDPDFLKGFDRGQAENGRLFIEANEIKKRLAEPAADQKPVDLNPTPEPTVDEEKAAERKSIRRAKESLSAMGAANEVAA